jgi:hypothetical protein
MCWAFPRKRGQAVVARATELNPSFCSVATQTPISASRSRERFVIPPCTVSKFTNVYRPR